LTHRDPLHRTGPSLLVDPLALAAVALMVLNDRWLKPTLHNELTGKLSDIAVCFFFPLFLAEVGMPLARWFGSRAVLWAGAVVAAALYTTLELSIPISRWACGCLAHVGPWVGIHGRFVMTRDLSDLWSLIMIVFALAWGEQRIAAHERNGASHAAL